MTTSHTATVATGLSDPVLDSQAVFRSVLEVLSSPGKIVTVPVEVEPPAPLHPTSAAVALSLFDLSTPYMLGPDLLTASVAEFVNFQTGARLTKDPSQSAFAIVSGTSEAVDWDAFAVGTPDYPDRSTTIIVQVADIEPGGNIRLSGPGIQTERCVSVTGVSTDFWASRQANAELYPLGTDVILASKTELVGIPRTTLVEF